MEIKTKTNSIDKMLVLGDMHMSDNLSYSEYIADQRIPEKKAVLDFIVKSAEDCNSIIFLGDNMNSKNNSAESIKEFVEFVERFNNKQIYILLGNHEKRGNGKSALDFMKEIYHPNWHIITKPIQETINGEKVDFLPYMSNPELGVNTYPEAVEAILRGLKGGTYLFAHHCISDTLGSLGGISTNDFKEAILPKKELEKRYNLVVAGHIHVPQEKGQTIITGSVFTHDVGEKERFIWKISIGTLERAKDHSGIKVEKIKLPCREIWKIENPVQQELDYIHSSSIVKCIITDKKIDIEWVKKELKRFDAHILSEQYPNERAKVHFEDGAIDFTIPSLLEIYAKAKEIDIKTLLEGFKMIQS